MWNDFKAFIARGNILDLAIAVILGAAFSSIVKTLTDGILMPVVGLATGGIDFKILSRSGAKKAHTIIQQGIKSRRTEK